MNAVEIDYFWGSARKSILERVRNGNIRQSMNANDN